MYQVYDMIRRDQLHDIVITPELLKSFNPTGKVTPVDFLVGMLCIDGVVSRTDDIEPLLLLFREYDSQHTSNGLLSSADLHRMVKAQKHAADEELTSSSVSESGGLYCLIMKDLSDAFSSDCMCPSKTTEVRKNLCMLCRNTLINCNHSSRSLFFIPLKSRHERRSLPGMRTTETIPVRIVMHAQLSTTITHRAK
jgi:hypothetical protein